MIRIVKYRSKYKNKVSFVIRDTYKKFCAKDATKEAADEYTFLADSKKNKDFEKNLNCFEILYLAENKGKIVGIIGGRNNKISNLYVLSNYHKKGIGKKLLTVFENRAKKLDWGHIKVRSSLYGFSFYQKMGYKKTTGHRMFHGNKIQPVKKFL